MTLLRRRPRELYRVYDEDEFLEIDDWLDEAELDLGHPDLGDRGGTAPMAPCEEAAEAGPGRRRRRGLRRLAGVAVPAAVAMVASVVVVHDLRPGATPSGRSSLGPRSPRASADGVSPKPAQFVRPGSGLRRGRRAVRPARRAPRAPLHLAGRRVPTLTASTSTPAATATAATPRRARPEFGFER
jgi:hypothetical protein